MSFPNLNFYLGKIPSQPDSIFITEYHRHWDKEYRILEENHNYIQWWFPILEAGQNRHASTITEHEIDAFKQDPIAMERLVKSFKIMMDFFGFVWDESRLELVTSRRWKARFANLIAHPHNNLRIARIIKCLGLMGLYDMQRAVVASFIKEYKAGHFPDMGPVIKEHFIANAIIPKCECPRFKEMKKNLTYRNDSQVIAALKYVNLW